MKAPPLVLLLCAALLPCPLLAQTVPATRPAAFRPPPGYPDFDKVGAQVGDQLPDLPVVSEKGQADPLDRSLNGRPTLLITSSLTCPRSRSTIGGADALAREFADKINVVILYIIEAHPVKDVCPYTGVETVTEANFKEGILRRQPTDETERRKLAVEFRDRMKFSAELHLDAMDNGLWKALGGPPNTAVLLSPERVILARQGWFEPKLMGEVIEKALAAAEPDDPRERGGPDAVMRKVGWKDEWDPLMAVRDAKPEQFAKWLADIPELAGWVAPFFPRGQEGGCTLLQQAAIDDRLPLVRLLLDHGAPVNLQTIHQPSALHLAARGGDLAIMELLLAHGADVNLRADIGYGLLTGPTPLQEALLARHPDAAARLVKAGAAANFYTHLADGDLPALAAALKADASLILRPDGLDRPPLYYALASGNTDVLNFSLDHGARVDQDGSEGSPLAVAVDHKQLDMARLLLANHADVSVGTFYAPPIVTATIRDDVPMMELLVKSGANIGAVARWGVASVHIAAASTQPATLQAVLRSGASVEQPSEADGMPCGSGESDRLTPLHVAAQAGRAASVAILLQHGADPATQDAHGNLPIHAAMKVESADDRKAVITALLAGHADINAADADGHTVLDLANDPATIQWLKTLGAKPGPGRPSSD